MNLEYTTVDRILSNLHRNGVSVDEGDAIEWIGDALSFLQVYEIQEQAVAFLKVKNYEAQVPHGLHMVLQIAKYVNARFQIPFVPEEEVKEISKKSGCNDCGHSYIPLDNTGNLLYPEDLERIGYKPFFDMQWSFIPWTTSHYFENNFVPVRLSNHTLFNSLVCKEKKNVVYKEGCHEEYTIVGVQEKKFRFSFEEGFIALSYVRNVLDKETGYPLIPDQVSYTTAIGYYIRWKVAERNVWEGREGFSQIAQESERLWLKYAKQAKNYMKMPKTIDDLQDLLEQSHTLIPRHRRYYNYFGNLGRPENLKF